MGTHFDTLLITSTACTDIIPTRLKNKLKKPELVILILCMTLTLYTDIFNDTIQEIKKKT